jgi:hypothetical protein
MTWADIKSFLESWFNYPGVGWDMILIAIALALFFGAFWLIFYRQPRSTGVWFLPIAIFSALFTVVAMAFVQVPLSYYASQALTHFWSLTTLNDWLLLAGLPIVLIGALVQEGAKMVPIVVWWRGRQNLDPKLGLAIGAIAGYGFGVFEGFWVNASVLGSGWTWDTIISNGFLGIAPYWERFFFTGSHIALSALAGYGLTKGLGWQFYLIAAGLDSLVNYGPLIYQKGYFTVTQLEIYIAVVAVLITIFALVLRWRKGKAAEPIQPVEPPAPVETGV